MKKLKNYKEKTMKQKMKRSFAFILALAMVLSLIFIAPDRKAAADGDETTYKISGYYGSTNRGRVTRDDGYVIADFSFCLDNPCGTPGSSNVFTAGKLSEMVPYEKEYTVDKVTYTYTVNVFSDNAKRRLLQLLVAVDKIEKFIETLDFSEEVDYIVNNYQTLNYETGSVFAKLGKVLQAYDGTDEEQFRIDVANVLESQLKSAINMRSNFSGFAWAFVYDDSQWDDFVKNLTYPGHGDSYHNKERNNYFYSDDPMNDPHSLWNVYYAKVIKFMDEELPNYFDMGYDALIFYGDKKVQNMLGAPFKPETKISKVNADTDEPVGGIRFQLKDDKNNIIDEWVSDDSELHTLKDLYLNREYTLHEVDKPAEYFDSIDVKFKITSDGFEIIKGNSLNVAEDGTLLFKNEPYGIRIVKKDKDDDTVITGALFAILDEDDKVITVTDDVRITELNINADYRIVEVKAPEGYKLIKDAEEVGFSLDGNLVITLDDEDKAEESGIEAESHTFTVKNEKTEVKVSKVDLTGDPLTGAAFEILDDEKNVAATLDADNGYTAYGLKVSTDTEENIYTLHEKTAPLGYVVAADTQFKLDKYGEITLVGKSEDASLDGTDTIKVVDKKTSVSISKVDIADGAELEGATIQILNEDGDVVEEWVSTDEAHVIEGLTAGVKYTLHEEAAPDGYLVASDTEFEIADDGTVTTTGTMNSAGVILVEDSVTSVNISKVAAANSKELPGAELTLKGDADWDRVLKLIADNDDHNVEAVIENGVTTGIKWTSTDTELIVKGLTAGEEYTLIETGAPAGYAYSEDIKFIIEDSGNGEVVKVYDAESDIYKVTDDVVMVDELDNGKLVIVKTVDGLNVTDEEKAGALKFTICNEDGKYLDENGNLHDKKYEITLDSFTKDEDGRYVLTIDDIPSGKYTVTETNSEIEGYDLTSDSITSAEGEVTFKSTTEIELKDIYEEVTTEDSEDTEDTEDTSEISSEDDTHDSSDNTGDNSTENTVNEDDDISTATIITTETTGTDDNVKTGDTFNLGIPVMLMMIALSGVVFIEGKRKRNKDQ